MKIILEDGSFLELIKKEESIRIVICGLKSKQELTMSFLDLNAENITKVIDFLNKNKIK